MFMLQVRGEYSNSLMRSLIEIVRNEGKLCVYNVFSSGW